MKKNKAITLSSIFEQTSAKRDDLYEVVHGWNFKDLNTFILSFEKLNQDENISFSKKYGNIAKQITRDILEEDCGGYDLKLNKKYSDEYIIKFVNSKKCLLDSFTSLYEEISKRNQWKLEMPLTSIKYDFLLDRYNNNFDRFNVINPFLHENKKTTVKDIKTGSKIKIKLESLNENEVNEIEKVYYLLVNNINRKKDGTEFLKRHNSLPSDTFK